MSDPNSVPPEPEAEKLAALRKDIEAAMEDVRAGREADLDFDAIRARAAAALRNRDVPGLS